jgi:hypothetical protein
MKSAVLNFLMITFFIGLSEVISAQQAITAGGGSATGDGGSVSYTVGQIAFRSISGTDAVITQGVQQPYEISVVTAIRKIEEITLESIVYPNPTMGKVKLVLGSYDNEDLRFRLTDINGALLQDKIIENKETEISMENLSSSVYFLKVIRKNREVKVFRIVKH